MKLNLDDITAPVGMITGILAHISIDDVTTILSSIATITCAVVTVVKTIRRSINKKRGDNDDSRKDTD